LQTDNVIHEAEKLMKRLRHNHLNHIRRWSIQGEAADIIEELLKSLQCKENEEQGNKNDRISSNAS
jgi:hypothetical protein